MEILIDSADLEEIKRLCDLYPVDGVTTNPTIISKEKKPFLELAKEIYSSLDDDMTFHVQTIAVTSEEIIEEAEYLAENISKDVYIKVPVIPEGIKALKVLNKRGFNTTATAVITPQQALMAAKAGADYIAPYVNRVSNLSIDGTQTVKEIVTILKNYNFTSKVLGASFKNVDQINKVSLNGAHAITASPDMIDAMQSHLLTDWSVDQFGKDWEKAYGPGANRIYAGDEK